MKELEGEFRGRGETKGYNFIQVLKSENAFLYQVVDETANIHYETFRRKENKQFDCISYPKSNSFGVWAWTHRGYESALLKFNELSINKELQTNL